MHASLMAWSTPKRTLQQWLFHPSVRVGPACRHPILIDLGKDICQFLSKIVNSVSILVELIINYATWFFHLQVFTSTYPIVL